MLGMLPTPILLDIAILFTALCWAFTRTWPITLLFFGKLLRMH